MQDTSQAAPRTRNRARHRSHVSRLTVLFIAALFALALASLAAQSSRPSWTNARASYVASSARSVANTPIAPGVTGLGVGQIPAAPTPTPTETPAPSTTPTATATAATSSSSPGWGLPDPAQWAQQALAAVLSAFFSGALTALLGILAWAQGLGGSAFNFITRTPPEGSYASSSVVTLWTWVVGVADAALALLVMWGGYLVMSRHALDLRAHSAMQILPRIALAALAANLSLAFATFFIDLGNALSDGVGQVALPGYATASAVQQDLATLILAVVYAVVGFLLVAQMLLRLALLDVLIVLAPLGFLCWALPTTQAWARLWASTFVATALVQFLQMLALRLGALLVNELTPGRLDSATLTLLVGIAALVLTFKLPGMLQNWALRSVGAASTMGALEQGAAVVQAISSVAAMAFT